MYYEKNKEQDILFSTSKDSFINQYVLIAPVTLDTTKNDDVISELSIVSNESKLDLDWSLPRISKV